MHRNSIDCINEKYIFENKITNPLKIDIFINGSFLNALKNITIGSLTFIKRIDRTKKTVA